MGDLPPGAGGDGGPPPVPPVPGPVRPPAEVPHRVAAGPDRARLARPLPASRHRPGAGPAARGTEPGARPAGEVAARDALGRPGAEPVDGRGRGADLGVSDA